MEYVTSKSLKHEKIAMVCFCPVGQSLSVIFSDNNVGFLDLESGGLLISSLYHRCDSAVLTMNWTSVDFSSDCPFFSRKNQHFLTDCAQAGGLNQIQRSAMHEIVDNSAGEINHDLCSPALANNGWILLSACESGRIFGYTFGMLLLFVLDGQPNSNHIWPGLRTKSTACIVSTRTLHVYSHLDKNTFNVSSLYAHGHIVQLQLSLMDNFSELYNIFSDCGRIWRDACKVIIPKVSLLKVLLESYQLRLTPVQFMHSISLCGMWHPAAATAFSQHWNDQGITRLKSTIDSAAVSVVNTLSLRASPLITKVSLSCRQDYYFQHVSAVIFSHRDLLLMLQRLSKSFSGKFNHFSSSSDKLTPHSDESCEIFCKLECSLEKLLFLLDECTRETKRSHHAMLKYIQV